MRFTRQRKENVPMDQTKLDASRAVMFALRMGTPSPERAGSLILLPQFAPLDEENVLALLAQETRHLTCIAIQHRAALLLGWWLTEKDQADRQQRTRSDILGALNERVSNPVAARCVSLVGGSEQLTISYEALQRFMLDYYLPLVDYRIEASVPGGSSTSCLLTVHFSPAAFDQVEVKRIA